MTEKEQKKAAKEFVERWKDKGYEKGESQLFWIDLLEHVFGVENITDFISFEGQVKLDHTSFIDGYINATHVMIEQKSLGKNLRQGIKQSNGSVLSPFQQAKRYSAELPYSKRPRWIITCNFGEFLVYDMEKPNGEPEQILLKDLEKEYYRLQFIVETENENLKREMEISLQAGELVGNLYNALLKQYKNPESEETLKSLNMLCVRLVFCLYAEDAGIFGSHQQFGKYIKDHSGNVKNALRELFKVLDMTQSERDEYDSEMDDDLAAFPYVNGGLFADENIKIPQFSDEIIDLLVHHASEGFDWSDISPTIFGAVFESTLNPETRRSGGMHYTSIENIHKVIDTLFLDDLKAELDTIKALKTKNTRVDRLKEYRKKLASLVFLDPACGSGNFLTETYISLRKLENESLITETEGQAMLSSENDMIQVSIGQFYGIEINDFAVTVAKTALWIAESQMMQETEKIMQVNLDFLPLKSYANIVEGNALKIDWESVVSNDKLSYIIGNPPFVGFTYMSSEQKEDMQTIFPKVKNIDFVCAWYKKASDYIKETKIECAFVSTNSITQGETVCRFWGLIDIVINFAYSSFIWDSEANLKAHVHCVIIGFSNFSKNKKYIFQNGLVKEAKNINAYLCDAPNIIIESRNKPICNISKMIYGNKPADGGNLIIEIDAYDNFVKNEPQSLKYIKPLLGAVEYLHNKKRYCLWLVDANPSDLKKCPMVMERIKKCKEVRENSVASAIRKFAETPTLFAQRTQPVGVPFVIVPRVSSEQRKYIPMSFLDGNTVVSDAVQIVPNATLYEFGILTSNVHMAWMRTVCGRLKSDYRYSKDIVYNNFPWCNPTLEQKAKIEQTAQAILDARVKYSGCSLADLYNELTMPPELRKAHQANDFAVMNAYGFPKNITESECVAELMKMYQELTR